MTFRRTSLGLGAVGQISDPGAIAVAVVAAVRVRASVATLTFSTLMSGELFSSETCKT